MRTDLEMEASGAWAEAGKVGGKRAWRHETGTMVKWDCNAWGWRVDGHPFLCPTLAAARHFAENPLSA